MAPVTQATDAGAIEKLVVDAALAIASKAGWEQLRLHAIADRTGRPLAEIGRRFRDITVEPGLGPEHHQRLRAVGFDDVGILQITLIASWFNYINRVADALGVGRE